MAQDLLAPILRRLSIEKGTLFGQGALRFAMTYPSPYTVGMSSLGFQTLYRILNGLPDVVAERAFLPDDVDAWKASRRPLITYESQAPVGDFDVIGMSVAYELEIVGVFDCLELAGVPLFAKERTRHDPIVLMGGPLTNSNPLTLGPFADVIIMGEAEQAVIDLAELMLGGDLRRDEILQRLSTLPGFYVPQIHGERLLPIIKAPEHLVPAYSVIVTPETELSNMFLIEAERGCSRGCTFCVMRRSTNGGMRLNDIESVLRHIPDYAPRVGLVGAAVTDHPKHVELVEAIVKGGRGIGVSSLRADRITPEFTSLLRQGGYRTITIASDGASERMRRLLRRRIKEAHLIRAAECAKEGGLKGIKVYMMLGVPGELEEDVDELIRFTKELTEILPVTLGISPFVPKRNTPLADLGFTNPKVTESRLKRLDKAIRPRAKVKSTSARWAWVEYRLARAGWDGGLAALEAHKNGGKFGDWKRAFAKVPEAAVWTRPGVEGAPLKLEKSDIKAMDEIRASEALALAG